MTDSRQGAKPQGFSSHEPSTEGGPIRPRNPELNGAAGSVPATLAAWRLGVKRRTERGTLIGTDSH